MTKTRKIALGVLGIWSAFTSFISPIWFVLTFLYLTGKIYQYDSMLDEGTAEILGIVSLVIWILAVLLPDITLLKNIWKRNHKYLFITLALMLLLAVACTAMCGWDIVAFLTTPGTKLNISNVFNL